MRRERFEARGIHIPYFAWPVGARVFQPNDSKAVLFFGTPSLTSMKEVMLKVELEINWR